jgi:hypothetical protein
MQECNPPRNIRLRLIETVRSRGRSKEALRPRCMSPPDDRSLMP